MKFFQLLIISLIFLIIAMFLTFFSSKYIYENFGEPPVVKDLLWEKLPYLPILWLSEIFLIFSVIYGVIWAIRINKNLIPYTIILISIFHIIRAGLIVLTPLGFPYPYGGFIHKKGSIFLLGAFPSGHLSVPYFISMVSEKKIFLILTILVGITLLLSRAHYSIDLIGTLLIAYPIYKFGEKYFKKYFKK